jgi:hypothetical protein
MKVTVTTSLIALGVALGIVDTANAINEGSYQNSSPAIEPKLESDARIIGCLHRFGILNASQQSPFDVNPVS